MSTLLLLMLSRTHASSHAGDSVTNLHVSLDRYKEEGPNRNDVEVGTLLKKVYTFFLSLR